MDFLSILRSNGPQKTSDRTGGCWYGLQTLTCMIWLALNTECKISNIPFEILWSFKLQTEDSRDEKTNKIKLQSFLFHSVPRQFHLGIITKFHPSNKQVRVLQRLNLSSITYFGSLHWILRRTIFQNFLKILWFKINFNKKPYSNFKHILISDDNREKI